MTVKCELLNFKQSGNAFDNPKVVIEDDGVLSQQIRISIGEEYAVVRADELEKAIRSCTNLPF